MQSKILLLSLLSAIFLVDLSSANDDIMAVLCSLANENALWIPAGNRFCKTGCLTDENDELTVVVLNHCRPDITTELNRKRNYEGMTNYD